MEGIGDILNRSIEVNVDPTIAKIKDYILNTKGIVCDVVLRPNNFTIIKVKSSAEAGEVRQILHELKSIVGTSRLMISI